MVKGKFCPYSKKVLFCQEDSGCSNCQVYLDWLDRQITDFNEDDVGAVV